MVQQYSVDIERELPGGIALEVGYVGSHTTHLTLGNPSININALNPSYLQGSVFRCPDCQSVRRCGLTGTVAGQTSGTGGHP